MDRELILKKVIAYCINNRESVIGFSSLSHEDRDHIYNIAVSIVMARDYNYSGGSFVTAIRTNNLSAAVTCADDVCIKALKLFHFVNEYCHPLFQS